MPGALSVVCFESTLQLEQTGRRVRKLESLVFPEGRKKNKGRSDPETRKKNNKTRGRTKTKGPWGEARKEEDRFL